MSKLYVLDAIRAHLKARQLTYKDLALGLGLSETSVKRLFASADCSLERLEQICQFLQLEFADLFRSAPKKRALIAQLTHDQEVEFATHRHLLMVAVCALIHLPEKLKDGSITYNYANGVSINSNRVNGEYHMLVPDGSGGTIVYSRKADESGYTVREIHTDKTGAVTLDFTGTQASLDAEIKPLAYQWSTGEEVGKVQVFANGSSITSVQDMSTQDITETVRDSQQNVVESKTYDNTAARVEEAQYNALLAGVELFDAIRHKNNLGAVSAITRLVNESRIAAEQPVVFSPQVGAVLGLIGALDSFADAQTDAQKLVATARLVLSANTTYAAFNNGKGFLDAGAGLTTMNVAGGVLALASLKDALESGNPFAIASTVMTLTNSAVATGMLQGVSMFGPQAMIAVAICSVVFASLFEVEYPDPPPAGTVEIGRLADGTLGLLIKDEAGGQVHQTRRLDGQVVSDSAKATERHGRRLSTQGLSLVGRGMGQ